MALVKSEHRYARIASTKVNRLLPIVRGREVGESLSLLKALPNRAARLVEAVIQTAAANAAEAGVRNVEKLRIVEAVANQGPTYKRIRPRARGMAYLERHRSSHIRIGIDAPEL
ncbi:MAG: 50S ribosomal protein L22 [Planctomycetota bacterium]|jgi:large subunit ribosomal protein L22